MDAPYIEIVRIILLSILSIGTIVLCCVNYYIFKALKELRKSLDASYSAIENIDTNTQQIGKIIEEVYSIKEEKE